VTPRPSQLYVEPFLIEEGYVQVGHGGRILTDRLGSSEQGSY
jgi:Holliday junction resolvasome RuvABC ATP-dependent DNA helicase subunit